MNAYSFKVTDENGNDIDVTLRLDLGGQKKLSDKYKDSTMETIFRAPHNIEVMCDVLTNALNFKNNKNIIKKGSDLYDLMVENGMGGIRKWQLFMNEIAAASGIVDDEEKEALNDRANTAVDKLLKEDDDEPKN